MSDCKPLPFRVHAKFYAKEVRPNAHKKAFMEVNPPLPSNSCGYFTWEGFEYNVATIAEGRIITFTHAASDTFDYFDGKIDVRLKDHCSCQWRKEDAAQ